MPILKSTSPTISDVLFSITYHFDIEYNLVLQI